MSLGGVDRPCRGNAGKGSIGRDVQALKNLRVAWDFTCIFHSTSANSGWGPWDGWGTCGGVSGAWGPKKTNSLGAR